MGVAGLRRLCSPHLLRASAPVLRSGTTLEVGAPALARRARTTAYGAKDGFRRRQKESRFSQGREASQKRSSLSHAIQSSSQGRKETSEVLINGRRTPHLQSHRETADCLDW